MVEKFWMVYGAEIQNIQVHQTTEKLRVKKKFM